MAKQNKEKQYTEAEMITIFGLVRIISRNDYPLLAEWTAAETTLSATENEIFEQIYLDCVENIAGWGEEDLKMLFISFVLRLGHLKNNHRYHVYFEKTISATVENVFLKTKTDFMVAKGVLNLPQIPYFHFQEYKPLPLPPKGDKRGNGEPMAQLIVAFLIAQTQNANGKPLYGCEVIGENWKFVVMEGKSYYVSEPYNCTKRNELLKIIAILRKFKAILETTLLD